MQPTPQAKIALRLTLGLLALSTQALWGGALSFIDTGSSITVSADFFEEGLYLNGSSTPLTTGFTFPNSIQTFGEGTTITFTGTFYQDFSYSTVNHNETLYLVPTVGSTEVDGVFSFSFSTVPGNIGGFIATDTITGIFMGPGNPSLPASLPNGTPTGQIVVGDYLDAQGGALGQANLGIVVQVPLGGAGAQTPEPGSGLTALLAFGALAARSTLASRWVRHRVRGVRS